MKHLSRFFFCAFSFILLVSVNSNADWNHTPIPVNSDANPGVINPHSNSGGRRIVRINGTTIVICPVAYSERTYRSVDNGSTWTEIDTDGSANSGCLISGPDNMVYHFYRSNDRNIYMVKFRYDQTPPTPVSIHDFSAGSDISGEYRNCNAIVDSTGRIYVSTHWGNPDRLYVLRSSDNGDTWEGPWEISAEAGPWYYPHLEVTEGGLLVCVYQESIRGRIMFAKSEDQGMTWSNLLISDESGSAFTMNPSILTVGSDTLYMFAQSSVSAHKGLVFRKSEDRGASWGSDWISIDQTCGYGDPSPALGSDGSIYVAYRSSNGTGVTTGSCGDQSRSRLAMSSDSGQTWSFVDDYYGAERTGTRYQTRYQTWWNYGGPLEWIWMQYEDGGTNRPIYYDINTDVTIYQASAGQTVSLEDAVNVLKISVGDTTASAQPELDIDGNNTIGVEDCIYILQSLADLR